MGLSCAMLWPPESCLIPLISVTNSQGNKPGRSVDPLLYGGKVWCLQKMQGGGRCAVLTFATSVVQGSFVCQQFMRSCWSTVFSKGMYVFL